MATFIKNLTQLNGCNGTTDEDRNGVVKYIPWIGFTGLWWRQWTAGKERRRGTAYKNKYFTRREEWNMEKGQF